MAGGSGGAALAAAPAGGSSGAAAGDHAHVAVHHAAAAAAGAPWDWDGGAGAGGAAAHWLDRYGSGAVDGPAKGLRNSASARAAVLQQAAALRAQEDELRQYVAAQAAEAAADAGGWGHAYGLEGGEDGDSDDGSDAAGDEEADLVAAAAAAAAAAWDGAEPMLPPAAATWARAVAPPLVAGLRSARAPAACEEEAPAAPFWAAAYAEMAGVGGATAAVPGAGAVEELAALPPTQRQQLRALIFRHHRQNERPVVGALASVAASFPGCCSTLLNAASGRQAEVAAALSAIEAAFGGPGSFSSAFRPSALRRPSALLARGGSAGAGGLPSARRPAAPALPGAAPLAALARAAAAVPVHAMAEGQAVRLGDPDGPRFELVKRNVYVSRERPKRMPRDEVTVCSCRCAVCRCGDKFGAGMF
jgi:hypothetical protein